MPLYSDSHYPVSERIVDVHIRQLHTIVAPGTWYSGHQRRAVAIEARKAGYAAGLLEPPRDGVEDANYPLSKTAVHVCRTIAASIHDLNKDFFDAAVAGGLSEPEFVEIVGIVSRIVDLDVFARGIGVVPRPLPAPEEGEPSRIRPATAIAEHAFVATIPNGPDGGEIGQALYHGQPMPYIVRALSLVPDELTAHVELEVAHYTQLDKLFDYDYQHHEGLSRPQAELVAGRVSALNDCFY